MKTSSDELNYLIWRYFRDEGLEDLCQLLEQSTGGHDYASNPPECQSSLGLVELVLKGLQLSSLEASSENDDLSVEVQNYIHAIDNGMASSIYSAAAKEKLPSLLREEQSSTGDVQMRDGSPGLDDTPAGSAGYNPAPKPESLPGAMLVRASGNTVAMGFEKDDTKLYEDKICIAELKYGTNSDDLNVTALCWSWSGELLASGSLAGSIRIWTHSGAIQTVLQGHRLPILSLAWNSNQQNVMSVDCANNVIIWDVNTGEQLRVSHAPPEAQDCTADAAWIDNRNYAIAYGQTIAIQKVTEQAPHAWFHGHSTNIERMSFDPTSQLLASGSEGGEILIWHGKSQLPIRSLHWHSSLVTSLIWIPASLGDSLDKTAISSRLLSAGTDGQLICWDVNSSTPASISKTAGPVLDMEINTAKSLLAVISDKLEIYRVDLIESKLSILSSYAPATKIVSVAWAGDNLYATGPESGMVFDLKSFIN